MSARVKLSGRLAGNEETNGLDAIAGQLVEEAESGEAPIRVALVWFDVEKVTLDVDSGAALPTVRVRRIEPLGVVGDVPEAVRTLAQDAHEKRTGRTPLPFDDVEVEDALAGVDE